jgi:hypothetical protein
MTETTTARQFRTALIGLVIGVAVGFAVQKGLGVAIVAIIGGSLSTTVASGLLLEWLPPVCAVAGVLLALRIDSKRRRDAGGRR